MVKAMCQLNVGVHPELSDRFDYYCRSKQLRRGEVVSIALTEFLAKEGVPNAVTKLDVPMSDKNVTKVQKKLNEAAVPKSGIPAESKGPATKSAKVSAKKVEAAPSSKVSLNPAKAGKKAASATSGEAWGKTTAGKKEAADGPSAAKTKGANPSKKPPVVMANH